MKGRFLNSRNWKDMKDMKNMKGSERVHGTVLRPEEQWEK